MKTTLRNVADETGLHPSTVSRILNGYEDRTSAATRKRVLEVANRLGYQPNFTARALRTNRSMTIGLIAPNLTDLTFARMYAAAHTAARSSGYHVLVSTVDVEGQTSLHDLESLIARGVDGVLLATLTYKDPVEELADRMHGAGTPFLLVNRRVGDDYAHVGADEHLGGYLPTRHLIDLGHRDIVFIGGIPEISTAEGRLSGYRAALEEAGLTVDKRRIVMGGFRAERSMEATEQMLALRPRPTAIVTADDMMAIAARRVILERGLRIPEDISLTGYNDLPMGEFVNPRLTTVHNDLDRIGETSAAFLIEAIHSGNEPRSAQLTPELIVRGSTGPAPE